MGGTTPNPLAMGRGFTFSPLKAAQRCYVRCHTSWANIQLNFPAKGSHSLQVRQTLTGLVFVHQLVPLHPEDLLSFSPRANPHLGLPFCSSRAHTTLTHFSPSRNKTLFLRWFGSAEPQFSNTCTPLAVTQMLLGHTEGCGCSSCTKPAAFPKGTSPSCSPPHAVVCQTWGWQWCPSAPESGSGPGEQQPGVWTPRYQEIHSNTFCGFIFPLIYSLFFF